MMLRHLKVPRRRLVTRWSPTPLAPGSPSPLVTAVGAQEAGWITDGISANEIGQCEVEGIDSATIALVAPQAIGVAGWRPRVSPSGMPASNRR